MTVKNPERLIDPGIDAAFSNVVHSLLRNWDRHMANHYEDLGRLFKAASASDKDDVQKELCVLLLNGFFQFGQFIRFLNNLTRDRSLRDKNVNELTQILGDARMNFIGDIAKTFKYDFPDWW